MNDDPPPDLLSTATAVGPVLSLLAWFWRPVRRLWRRLWTAEYTVTETHETRIVRTTTRSVRRR